MKNAENWTYILIYVVSKYKSNYGGATHAISEHESVAVFCPEILKVKTILRPFSPSS